MLQEAAVRPTRLSLPKTWSRFDEPLTREAVGQVYEGIALDEEGRLRFKFRREWPAGARERSIMDGRQRTALSPSEYFPGPGSDYRPSEPRRQRDFPEGVVVVEPPEHWLEERMETYQPIDVSKVERHPKFPKLSGSLYDISLKFDIKYDEKGRPVDRQNQLALKNQLFFYAWGGYQYHTEKSPMLVRSVIYRVGDHGWGSDMLIITDDKGKEHAMPISVFKRYVGEIVHEKFLRPWREARRDLTTGEVIRLAEVDREAGEQLLDLLNRISIGGAEPDFGRMIVDHPAIVGRS